MNARRRGGRRADRPRGTGRGAAAGEPFAQVAISGMKQAGSIENPATEGMNEAGLCVSAQSFNYQRDASYQTKTGGDEPVVLGQGVVTFLLRSAETVADAVDFARESNRGFASTPRLRRGSSAGRRL